MILQGPSVVKAEGPCYVVHSQGGEQMSEPIAPGWITTDQAEQLTGYGAVYIRRLAREGRIPARKVRRDLLVDRDALLAYKARMDALGKSKYSPWRQDLIEEGRGRRQRGWCGNGEQTASF